VLSLKGKSVMVTGGAGFIGSHLVDRIAREAPSRLVVVDNLFLGTEGNLNDARTAFPDLRFHQADAADYGAMRRLVDDEQVDVLFDLMVIPLPTSFEQPRLSIDVNVAGATVAAELLRQERYETLVHFSSSEVYGTAQRIPMDEDHPLRPTTPYAASKAAGDHVVLSYQETFGLDITVVRPFNTIGPRQNAGSYAAIIPIVIGRALRGEPIEIHGDGEQTRDLTYVTAVAEAAVRVYEEPATRGRVINVASGEEITVNELVALLLEILGVNPGIVHTDPRPGDVRRHLASIDLARELIGYEPAGTLKQGLVDTVDWYRKVLAG
jgi:UDP-glucose 4-epimerase